MTNALYKVAPGQTQPPLASDINQYADVLNGNADIGAITFAAPISAPSSVGITATAATGTALGTGAYRYQFTYVTGVKKSDNTVVLGGETLPSASVTVTTTSGNQAVTLSGLPTAWPATAVALRIYRTAVGGADGTQKLVTTFTAANAATSYTDTTADGALGTPVPTTNTTGTSLGGNQSILQIGALELATDTRSSTETYTNGLLTQVVEQDGATTVRTTNLTYTNGLLTQVQEIAGGRTITTTITYTNGVMTGTSKTVS